MLTTFLLSPLLLSCLCLVEGLLTLWQLTIQLLDLFWMSYEYIMCFDTWPLSDSFRNDFALLVPVTQLWGRPWHTLDFTSHTVLVLTDTGHPQPPQSFHPSSPALTQLSTATFHLVSLILSSVHSTLSTKSLPSSETTNQTVLLHCLPWRLLFTDRNTTGVDQNGDDSIYSVLKADSAI